MTFYRSDFGQTPIDDTVPTEQRPKDCELTGVEEGLYILGGYLTGPIAVRTDDVYTEDGEKIGTQDYLSCPFQGRIRLKHFEMDPL